MKAKKELAAKKAYTSPRLETYGDLRSLTLGNNASKPNDGGSKGPSTKT